MDSDCLMSEASMTDPDSVIGIIAVDDSKLAKYEEKKALVEEEIRRMNQLPARSTYAAHRMRVLSKVLQLLSVQQRSAASPAGGSLCQTVTVTLVLKDDLGWANLSSNGNCRCIIGQ